VKLLGIDTSTEACSVAILLDGEVIEDYRMAPRQHAELILPMIEALLEQTKLSLQELDALAFGRGPGAFTGIRIATGVIQGLSLGTGLPVVGISTLAAMAQDASDRHKVNKVHVAIDARMNEIYCACYRRGEDGLMINVEEERVCLPEETPQPEGSGWFATGSGWATYEKVLRETLGDRVVGVQTDSYPRAAAICKLAEFEVANGKALPGEQVLPVYLRDKVTHSKRAPEI
jgi:tRNA threonylcarbamoyladenosine biosynthesis protein TsaB